MTALYEIGRRLIDGRWQTGQRDESGGGGGGGSQPGNGDQTSVYATLPQTGTDQPTLAEIDSTDNLVHGWTAETDYSREFVNTDVVILLKPTGSANLFAAEVNGTETGTDEPDWDGDAPNVGDDISDGDNTWFNVGVYATWLATDPAEWEADTEFAAGTLVVPPVASANDHLYVVFPPGPYTAAEEPDPWPTDGTYASGDSGYLYDLGPKIAAEWSRSFPNAEFTGNPRTIEPAIRGIVVGSQPLLLADNQDFRDANPDFEHEAQLQVLLHSGGQVEVLADTPTNITINPDELGGALSFLGEEGNGLTAGLASALGLLLQATTTLMVRGVTVVPADGSMPSNGDWAIAASDTALLIKKKTSGGVIKTLTIPWD